MTYFPLTVDNVQFPNIRAAHRAVYLPLGISYDRVQRSIKRGERDIFGHEVRLVKREYVLGLPLRPGDDGADLVRVFRPRAREKPRVKGTPLLFYPPGEKPGERGILHWR